MDLFTKLFGDFLLFVYHCFDRIVIRGYLTALSRPELVVHFFREIVGVAEVSKEALSQRTADYQNWVEAYARNHTIPIEWAEKGVRKEDHVLRWLRRMEKRNAYGVYFIFKSMEQGPSQCGQRQDARPRRSSPMTAISRVRSLSVISRPPTDARGNAPSALRRDNRLRPRNPR